MRTGIHFRLACLAFAVSTMSWASADDDSPNNEYFRGVEDRLAQAAVVVVGRPEVIHPALEVLHLRAQVTARIEVEAVLKGDPALREIEYTSVYSAHPMTDNAQHDYWGTEDMIHSQLIKHYPYGLPLNGVFFLAKDTEGVWEVISTYTDGKDSSAQRAIRTIITAEQQLQERPASEVLVPLLVASQPKMVRAYAVRSILRHIEAWPERATALLSAEAVFASHEFHHTFTMACVAARLRHERGTVGEARGLALITELVVEAPSVRALDSAVRYARRASLVFRDYPERADALRSALVDRRAALTGRAPVAASLTQKDRALLVDVGPRAYQ